ncbi:zinc finger protein 28-like isoform X2 [Danaus plexippus]|uniref:zinc finger protein 28-like isoform X2 n=1 Tax=Danaus plexippus TaxID=13037 RepID=UPI002AAF35D4|nr:zinc finger protein 28-like isoform X2 [Danaus plexippus]
MDKNYTSYGECRCCLVKGYHRDIMKEYYVNGTREVYIDIFMECFNLFLSTNKQISALICVSCVQKLKEANSFRLLVISSEEQLLDSITDKETVFVNVGVQSEVKTELQGDVKVEQDDSVFDCEEFLCDEETKDEEIVDREAEILSRFPFTNKLPDRRSLYTTCKGFVTHLDLLEGKLVLPKMIAKLLENDSGRSSKKIFVTEKMAHIHNASTLLEYSNATPFKSKNRSGFPCFFCRSIHDSLDKLKEHQSKAHKRTEIKKILATYGAECLVVYVDITDLKCTICDSDVPSLNELREHLMKIHKKKIHLEYTDRVIPFKLSTNSIYECQVCRFNFETFGSIERHMNVHYRNYVCNQCGTGFVTKYRLKVHMKSMHVGGAYPCDICKKVYTTQQKHKNHVDTVHKMIKRFKCTKCPERFSEYFRRQKHLVEVHGLAPLHYKCNVCDKAFDRRYTLSRHMKRDHLEERDYQCQLCSYKCFTNNELSVHMIKHNGERIHECSVCNKSYARKKTLREHMRIHNNDRRFSCAVCGQSFVQKCSLKGHVKTHHTDYVVQ